LFILIFMTEKEIENYVFVLKDLIGEGSFGKVLSISFYFIFLRFIKANKNSLDKLLQLNSSINNK